MTKQKKKTERQVLREIDLEFNLPPYKLYLNHSGIADYYGSKVPYGLLRVDTGNKDTEEKAPDRAGYVSVVITPEMVGATAAIFFVIEGKREGGIGKDDRQPAQQRAIDRVVKAGGIGGIADSVEKVRQIVTEGIRRLKRGKENNESGTSGRAGRGLSGGDTNRFDRSKPGCTICGAVLGYQHARSCTFITGCRECRGRYGHHEYDCQTGAIERIERGDK